MCEPKLWVFLFFFGFLYSTNIKCVHESVKMNLNHSIHRNRKQKKKKEQKYRRWQSDFSIENIFRVNASIIRKVCNLSMAFTLNSEHDAFQQISSILSVYWIIRHFQCTFISFYTKKRLQCSVIYCSELLLIFSILCFYNHEFHSNIVGIK